MTTLHRTTNDLPLVFECFTGTNDVAGIQKGSMLSLQNGVKSTRPVADTDDRACFESYYNREGLEGMSKALFNCEGKNVDGHGLNGGILG